MNIKIINIFTILFLIAQATASAAFVKTSGALQNKALCGIEFKNETSIYINVDSIISISRQIYIAGPVEVHEFAIDTSGNSQIRIYHSKTIDVQKQVDAVAERLPKDISEKVKPAIDTVIEKSNAVKNRIPYSDDVQKNATISNVYKVYPTTTHAKTLEFTVMSKEDFENLYNQFKEAFTSNKYELLKSTLFKEI